MVADSQISVMHLISSLNCGGGVEGVVLNLCNSLARRGIRTAVCILQDKADMACQLDENISVFTCGLPSRLRPGNALKSIKKLRGFIKDFNPDVIHSHLYSYTAPFAGLAGIGLKKRHVFSVHFAGEHHYRDRSLKNLIAQACERWTVRCAGQTVVGCSAAANQLAKDVFGVTDTQLIYNGINTEKFSKSSSQPESRDEIRKSIGCTPDDILVVCVGHLKPYKNQKAVVDAWPKVVAAVPNAKLVLVGDGPDRPEMEKKAGEYGISDKIIFLGLRKDVPVLLSACDAGILYSLAEGMPLALLEMMFMELPVIGSDIPPMLEVISQDVGMTAKSNSPDELSTVLIKMLSDRDNMRTLGNNGRLRAEKIFSLDSQAKAFSELYSELLNRKN